MRIQDIMSKPAVVCGETESLNTVARHMWDHDCGVIPIVTEDGRIAGIVTDRDVGMAAYTRGKTLAEIPVAQTMARNVFSCRADDSLESAARVMTDNQVRRLPVLDADDRPIGIVSFSDIVRYASTMAHGDGIDQEVVKGLAEITQPRLSPGRPAAHPPAAKQPMASPAIPRDHGQQRVPVH